MPNEIVYERRHTTNDHKKMNEEIKTRENYLKPLAAATLAFAKIESMKTEM